MIIDAFTFYNEMELLDFHINHVYDSVDKIIVVEGDRTYDGRPYKSKVKLNDPKVEHHIVPLNPTPVDRWENEATQRRLAGEIAKQFDGTLFFECVDEIVRSEFIRELSSPTCFSLDNYYYYFNGKDKGNSDHPMPIALPTKDITNLHEQWVKRHSYPTFYNAGWHFSYLGGADRIKQKLAAYSHVENDTDEVKANLDKNIQQGKDIFGRNDHYFEYVPIDDSFPPYLVANQEKFKEFIHE